MSAARKLLLAAAATALLAGCGTLNSLTGQTDNTVLPGQREDAIPGRSSFPEKQGAGSPSSTQSGAATTETYCAPDDPECRPPGADGTFSDTQ